MKKLLLILIPVLFIASCKQEEETTEPATFGTISGVITEFATDSVIYKANVFTEPATGYVTTDENGEYKISNIEPGEYIVTAAKSGYDTLKAGVTVVAGKTTTADFILHKSDSLSNEQYGAIAGKVIDAVTSQPVEQVTLYTSPASTIILSSATGEFQFERLQPATYILTAKKTGYDSLSVTVAVEAGYTSNAELTLTPTDTTTPPQFASVEGYVIDAVNGKAVANALIAGSPSFGTFFTDSTGFYKVNNIVPGDYTITVSKTYYADASEEITTVAGETVYLNFALSPTVGNVEGTVIDSTGAPIEGAIISTDPETGSFISDNEGKFKIENIAAGELSITAEKSGYVSKTISVTIEAGLTREAIIMLKKNSP